MFSQKTKIQICARNLASVEHDLTAIDFTGLDLVGAVNDGTPPVIGDTVVTVDGFSTNVPTGCIIGFAGDDTTYYVSTGASSTSITIDPPLRTNLADNQVVTVYPHFDISQYVTSVSNLSQRAEYNQAELIFDKPISYTLFNKNSVFYDRDTHSTGWGLTTAYFSTYNAQSDTDNQYVRISILRSGTWYQKYVGKIVRYSFELDEINRSVSFDTESIFYTLKDTLVSQIDDLYNLHKYTSTTRKTKTPSGKYVDVIRALFKSVGVQSKSYTVTNKEKSYSGDTYNFCKLTVGSHGVVPGELITVSIGDLSFDGTHIVYSVTSTTITYYFDSSWEYFKDDVNATVAAGGSSVVLQAGLGSDYNGFSGKCKFAAADTTVYSFTYTHSTKTIALTPVLSNEATINEDVYLSYPKLIASTGASGTLTAHRVYFDLPAAQTDPTDYFDVTHQGHDYNLLDLWWITEKWMVQDVEAETGFDLIKEICLQLGSCATIDYIDGVVYGFFRSKVNTSSSKITLTNSKLIGEMRTGGSWKFVSEDGVPVGCDVVYFNNESDRSEFAYSESLDSGDYQRFLSETPTPSVVAFERYSDTVNADAFNNLAVGDKIVFRGHGTIYKIKSVSGEVVIVEPVLRQSIRLGEKFSIFTQNAIDLKYSNAFNIKLKYPNIFVTDPTNKTISKYYNNGTATLGVHPLSYYTSEVLYTATNGTDAVAYIKLIPCADGYLNMQHGDMLLYNEDDGTNPSETYTLKTRKDFPQNGRYQITTVGSSGSISQFKRMVIGYGECESDDSAEKLLWPLMFLTNTDERFGGSTTQVAITALKLENAGDASTITEPIKPYPQQRSYGSRNARNNDRRYNGQKFNRSPLPASNANEFGLYKLDTLAYAYLFKTDDGGRIGTGISANSCFFNSDVLNPDYDDKIYADAGHAESIRRAIGRKASSVENVFIGTSPGANVVYCFIANHGESAAQEFYWYNNSDNDIYKNTSADWSGATSVFSGSTGVGNHIARWDKQDLSYQITGPLEFRKCYDNILVVADIGEVTLSLMDLDNSRTFCIDDSSGNIDSLGGFDIQCFTNWYEYQGATNSNIFENDVCFNASKLAYKFYSKNRRVLECNVRDADMGYIDYTLFDRFTVDSSILSAASGSPKFYVYAYDFNWETHDQKLTLLESVE